MALSEAIAKSLVVDGVELRIVPGYEHYAIDKTGRKLYRPPRKTTVKRGTWTIAGRWLTVPEKSDSSSGYLRACLTLNGFKHSFHIHVFVALAWIGPKPFPKAMVLHKDDNKMNNHVDNLYYGTCRDNAMDAIRNGKMPPILGERHGRTKYTNEQIAYAKYLLQTKRPCEVARELNIAYTTVREINTGWTWSHIQAKNPFQE